MLPPDLQDIVDRVSSEAAARDREAEEELARAIYNITDGKAIWNGFKANNTGEFRPLAKVVSSKSILLYVPETHFCGGWNGFKKARQEAINWMLYHRADIAGAFDVVDGFTLVETPLYFLEPTRIPVIPRTIHYNAAIDSPELFETAYKLAHIEQDGALKRS